MNRSDQTENVHPGDGTDGSLLSLTVDELVERWPETMRVLAPLGIDLCCGGGRRVGEAIRLHGADSGDVAHRLERVIATSGAPA